MGADEQKSTMSLQGSMDANTDPWFKSNQVRNYRKRRNSNAMFGENCGCLLGELCRTLACFSAVRLIQACCVLVLHRTRTLATRLSRPASGSTRSGCYAHSLSLLIISLHFNPCDVMSFRETARYDIASHL
eukprot:3818717-Rhodomonas_salina.3